MDEVYGQLKTDGFDIQLPQEEHGSYRFYPKSPGGFDMEVVHDEQT